MSKASLVIMAAGIGSRFGEGIKQLAAVGPNNEIIMDYSIYDALEAGFDKVIFVIRRDLEKEFKKVIGDRISRIVEVEYVFQEKEDIPERFREKHAGRKKPWGTGQAVLCCREVIKEPFLVINADDYYGKEAFRKAFDYLMDETIELGKLSMCMVGFILKNTLSENGGVTRGICEAGENGQLVNIVETKNIVKTDAGAVVRNGETERVLDPGSIVSMNMWGMHHNFIQTLSEGFTEFLEELESNEEGEYLLPTIIGGLLREKQAEVTVLTSNDQWFGVTYQEDKASVIASIRKLVDAGVYPEKLFT